MCVFRADASHARQTGDTRYSLAFIAQQDGRIGDLTTAPPWKHEEEKCMWFTEMSVPSSAAQLCLDG